MHGLWPQTAVWMKGGYAFGLSFNANAQDVTRHDTFHAKTVVAPPAAKFPAGTTVKVVKLVLNVHVLRHEFDRCVSSDLFVARLDPKTFADVSSAARWNGYSKEESREALASLTGTPRTGKPICGFDVMGRQIDDLRADPAWVKAWNNPDSPQKYPREIPKVDPCV